MKMDKCASLLQEVTKQMDAGKFSRAFTLLKDLLSLDPTHHEGRRLLATLLLKFGNLVTAKNAFDSLLQEAFQRQDYSLAESLLREYLAVGPRCIPFIEMLGQVHEHRGDPLTAVIEYEKAIKLLLDDAHGEGITHARELYSKIQVLAPKSYVVERLAGRLASVIPPNAIVMMPACGGSDSVTLLVSDTIAGPPSASEASDPPIVPSTPETMADVPVETDAVSTPFRYTSLVKKTSADLSTPSPVEVSVPSSLRLVESSTTQGSMQDSAAEFEAQVQAQAQTVASPESSPEAESKVPFPPVNRMLPSSVDVAENHSIRQPETDRNSNHDSEARPFWDKQDESSATHDDMLKAASSIAIDEAQVELKSAPIEISTPQSISPEEPIAVIEETKEIESARPELPQGTASQPAFVPAGSQENQWSLPDNEDGYLREVQYHTEVNDRPTRRKSPSLLPRLRIRMLIFRRRCVAMAGSMTRLILFLAGAVMVVSMLGMGLAAVAWIAMEERPTEAYADLAKTKVPRLLEEPNANGYLLLMGIEARPQANPVQEGHDRWLSAGNRIDEVCLAGGDGHDQEGPAGLFRSADPAGRMKQERGRLERWLATNPTQMTRYRTWLDMAFDDWGYGHVESPNCGHILQAHRLFVAEGFSSDLSQGLDHLEMDLGTWREVLSQAKTLAMKSMAMTAITDDIFVLSGLLNRPTLDNRVVQRISRLARPLDHDEKSLRWPMQNEFMLEIKRAESRLRPNVESDDIWATVVKRMPVPKQRTLNAYARYYDALIKTPQARGSTLPKLYDFAHTPARNILDTVMYPLDNVLRTYPVPDWERYIAMVMETDTRMRLAGLQARLRAASSEQQTLAKLAQAGPAFFDPYTELPMLLNTAQGRLYSVGRDGKDDGGEPTFDISVPIPLKSSKEAS